MLEVLEVTIPMHSQVVCDLREVKREGGGGGWRERERDRERYVI